MSNNRMWLRNKRTGQQILVAKYYPSTGWFTYHESLTGKLDDLFDKSDEPRTQWGSNDWKLEYEIEVDGS